MANVKGKEVSDGSHNVIYKAAEAGDVVNVVVEQVIEGVNHRRTLDPTSDISSEPKEVQDACNKAWTPDIIAAYDAHLEEAD